jgi:hypothetical protein
VTFFFCSVATLETLNSEQDNVNNNVLLRGFRANVGVVEAIIITCSECVFLTLGIQNAMRMRHIVICGLAGHSIFFHIMS